ncbi:MAG: rod shape-determining protein MreD [Defluviitaleaceae bacterium]|nr:rod shape-determining protein MreD [Defluviitaleaceae bacterium]
MTAIIILNYAFQTTLLPSAAVLGVTPDTGLILIVSYAIMRGDAEGAVFGFFSGLLFDLTGGGPIGIFALLGMAAGYVCGKPFKNFFRDNFALPLAVVPVAAMLYQFAFYFTHMLFRGKTEFWFYFGSIMFPKTIYTLVLAVPLYLLLYAVNGMIEKFEIPRRNFFNDDM